MSDQLFAGSIPAIYDRYLGGLLFQPWAAEMARRAAARNPRQVLEIAAGTGIVTRALDQSLDPAATIVATDLNQQMIDHAAANLAHSRLRFQQADAQALPFPDSEFDLAVCQFGFMFVPDKAKAYAETRRVLQPGGRALFNVWDQLSANPIPEAVADAVAACYPADPPAFLRRTPYAYHNTDLVRADLANVGFVDIDIQTVNMTSTAPSAYEIAAGLCQGTPMRLEIEARDPDRLDAITSAVEASLIQRFGTGTITAPMQALIVTAIRD